LQNGGYLLSAEITGQPFSKDCFKALCDVDNPISLFGWHNYSHGRRLDFSAQQFGQLGDVRRNAPRLVAGELAAA
jgi:hypothetical protein